jgi:hypothetical protein
MGSGRTIGVADNRVDAGHGFLAQDPVNCVNFVSLSLHKLNESSASAG